MALLQVNAVLPQDSVKRKGKRVIVIDTNKFGKDYKGFKDFDFKFDFDSSQFEEFSKSFKFNEEQILAMQENIRESLKDMPDMKNFTLNEFDFSEFDFDGFKDIKQTKTPTRTEKKSFTGISEVKFSHKYGNIIIQEANSKQIDLEIQYFDKNNIKGISKASTSGGVLSIVTEKSGAGAKVNYIISLPKSTGVDIKLAYGTVKVSRHEGPFKADLSYSDISAQALAKSKASFVLKYSDMRIDEVEDISVSGSYSDVRIKKARNMDAKGMYTDYRVDDVVSFSTSGSPAYGDIRLGTVSSVNLDAKYSDINIGNLASDMTVKTAYGDVSVKAVSPKLKSINVNAMYADVSLGIGQGMSVAFDADLTYGDMNISKKYNVKYTDNRETNTKSVKIGQIGSGKPTATIKVKNMYADVDFK